MAEELHGGTGAGQEPPRRRRRVEEGLARLLSIEPEERALRRMLGVVAETVPIVDSAALVVRDGDHLEIAAAIGLDEPTPDPGGELVERALRASDLSLVAAPGPPLPPGTRVAAAAPLAVAGVAGVLLIGTRGADRLDEDALLLLRVAADRAACAVALARLGREHDDARDTVRRAEADLETRRKAVDFILGVVGHDLRNPLGAVHMSASLLHSKGGLQGWQARAIERMRSSAGRMGRIIADLLSYTRTRLGNGLPIQRRPVSLEQHVKRVADELRSVNPDREIRLDVTGDPNGEWDPDRLEQVASNLLSNAIDHGDPAGPVAVELDGTGADELVLRVRNQGAGMPPEVLSHLFEPFARAPDEKNRKASGLGLGLYIAREIVRGHGGDIGATSGEETVVTVRLPRHPA